MERSGKTLFNHLDAILVQKDPTYFDSLAEEDKKTFNVYMINRFLSMHKECLPIVNFFQQYLNTVGPRETYIFYSNALPKKKSSFATYIKASVKEDSYEDWLVDLVSKYYYTSKKEAEVYLDMFYKTEEGKEELKVICEEAGIEPKQIKKVKL